MQIPRISVLELKIQFLIFMHARSENVVVFLPEQSTTPQYIIYRSYSVHEPPQIFALGRDGGV